MHFLSAQIKFMAEEAVPQSPLRVCLAWSPKARQVLVHSLEVAPGTTLLGALRQFESMDLSDGVLKTRFVGHPDWAFAIWGKKVKPDAILQEGDRIEITRALRVDPKIARRERFRTQGSRGAGLFTMASPPKNQPKIRLKAPTKVKPKAERP
jgi:putative ubiquitin-RnfH superfamily antitoxin RatB of RatAB toxin-antitoxin module